MIRMPSSGRSPANRLKEFRISSISLKKSRWSASMFRMISMVGKKDRKLLVYSQASVTNISGPPTRILPPMASSIPPTEMVGSFRASIRISVSMDVVVVFPWVPATATDWL